MEPAVPAARVAAEAVDALSPPPAPQVAPPAPVAPVVPVPVVVAPPAAAEVPPPVMPAALPAGPFKTLTYQASGLRKTMLSFVLLLLLPFYGSLGPMFLQRFGNVPPLDLIGFVAMASAFTVLMALILFELLVSIRSRVVLGPKAVKFTLPSRGGLVPAFSYATHEVPYDEIDHVEIRREVYGGRLAPVLMRGARIVTKDGQKIPLGYVSEANEDAVIPFPEIAEEICRRVGRASIDRGSVRRSVRKKMLRLAASTDENTPMSDSEITALNRGHSRLMIGLVGCLVVLVAAGIVRDVMLETGDHGERAANAAPPVPPLPKKPGRT
jgi:hypothetical protein